MESEWITAVATMASVAVAAYSIRATTKAARDSILASNEASQKSLQASREALEKTNLSNRILKTVDVSTHCANRYEELGRLRLEIIKLEAEEQSDVVVPRHDEEGKRAKLTREKLLDDLSDHYFRRFWALKSDQFDYWLNGVLDHDTFYDWSYYLVAKVVENREKPRLSARHNLEDSWRRWRDSDSRAAHGGSNPTFVKFTDDLLHFADRWKYSDGYLPLQVLNLIKKLEGTPAEAGFSRRWRFQIWQGMEFEQFEEAMRKDLQDRTNKSNFRDTDDG